ncbi:MAG: TAXI family TRAP transporter solute-binding subunit [Hyphomicrobiaceae bacterium]
MPAHARKILLWLSALTVFVAATLPVVAQTTEPPPRAEPRRQTEAQAKPRDKAVAQQRVQPTRAATSEAKRKEAINSWTVGLAAGRTEGAPLQFAAELARVLDDGDNMRVLPIVTRGIFDNIFDLLYLRGVDAAIVYGDVLEHFKKTPDIQGISKRINFLVNLFPSELHVFVRPEIKSLADLAGKPVNFNTEGTAAAYSGPIIFERLGIKVDARFVPHNIAMEEMKKGPAYAATVWVSSKPLAPFLKGKFPEGFKFLPVEHTDKLDYYMPSYLEASDYPALIPAGQRIATISVPAVLAVYDWPADTDRHRRVVRFVDYLFQRFEKLQTEPGYHPKWKDVNLAATVPGWQRFRPLQDRLDKIASQPRPPVARTVEIDTALARRQAEAAAPGDTVEQERLFKQFLEWSKQQRKP